MRDSAIAGDEETTAYVCERCGHTAAFPLIAFSPIGHALCTDPGECALRQLQRANRVLEHA